MNRNDILAGLVLAAALAGAASAQAAALPTGAWACRTGPSWDDFKVGVPVKPTVDAGRLAKVWIFDQSHYASSSETDRGVFSLKGDSLVARSGPFTRAPMSIRYSASGLDGRPTLFLNWSTAPKLFIDCQPA